MICCRSRSTCLWKTSLDSMSLPGRENVIAKESLFDYADRA